MRVSISLLLVLALVRLGIASAAGDRPADEARPRVTHHLRAAGEIAREFEDVLAGECPRCASAGEWDAYLDAKVDRVVTFVAHLDQAWAEAKRTGDKDVRRMAKTPRVNVDRARLLLAKLRACADGNGTSFVPGAVWGRIEREAERRQSEIALPR